MQTIVRLVVACALLVGLSLPAQAQTALTTTTLAAATTPGSTTVSLSSATGVTAGGGLYVGREYMTVASSYTTGTTIPVIRAARAVAHASGEPVYVGPAIAFINTDRAGSCTPSAEAYLPQINVTTGAVWNCFTNVEKWVNEREAVVVSCRALLVADQADQSCFTADRPYLVYKLTEVHATAESAGTLTLVPRRQQGTEAPASGDQLTAAAIDMVGAGAVAQTVKTPTLSTSEALLMLSTGDRLGLDYTDDTAGELAGVVVTFYLYPL